MHFRCASVIDLGPFCSILYLAPASLFIYCLCSIFVYGARFNDFNDSSAPGARDTSTSFLFIVLLLILCLHSCHVDCSKQTRHFLVWGEQTRWPVDYMTILVWWNEGEVLRTGWHQSSEALNKTTVQIQISVVQATLAYFPIYRWVQVQIHDL